MLNTILADFYVRDIRKLIEEINLFKNEEDLWRTEGAVRNSAGNLVLHIIGGTNYLIGNKLADTGYVRNRDQEFIQKGVDRKDLVSELNLLIGIVKSTLNGLSPDQMEVDYPMLFDDKKVSTSYLLVQLLAHLNYHLGQINYLRRILE